MTEGWLTVGLSCCWVRDSPPRYPLGAFRARGPGRDRRREHHGAPRPVELARWGTATRAAIEGRDRVARWGDGDASGEQGEIESPRGAVRGAW